MNITLDMIGIVTSDMDESLRFYRALGLEAPYRKEGDDHLEVTLPNGLRLAWDSLELIRQLEPDWKDPVGQRVGLAFRCDTPADVDQAYERLVKEGFKSHKQPWDAFWGQRYAQVYDPDGNVVDLFAWLAGQD